MAVLPSTHHKAPNPTFSTSTNKSNSNPAQVTYAKTILLALFPARSTIKHLTFALLLNVSRLISFLGLLVFSMFFSLRTIFHQTKHFIAALWARIEPMRKKLFFEFMVWLLNPYAVALFVFWPGWWILGLGLLWWRIIG